jgi:signal transduction histidine kinase/CheY-like chemotaxis protein
MWADFHLPSGVLISVGHDITEQKREVERRQRLEAQVRQAQKLESLGVLAGGIAHDFNNLLMSVLGNADLALSKMAPESPALGYVRSIETAAQRAADLANQLLAYSGKGRFVVEAIDLSRLVEEMTHLVEVSVSKKAVVHYHLESDMPAIQGDPTQLRQVVINLITNASEAIGDHEGLISISTGSLEFGEQDFEGTLAADGVMEGRYAFLEVLDTGCGMDEETQTKIFDPFFTTKFTGRGLGLASVLGIVRGQGGAIKLDSQPGRGTTVRVFFPTSGDVPAEEAPHDSASENWRGQGTVLLVDDEPTVRTVAQRMLEELGFEVLTAIDGQEAVEMFRRNADQVALVIVDLTMPRMSGEEALREILRIRRDARVIMSSGYGEHDTTKRLADGGLAGFIQKPYKLGALRRTIRQAVGER